MQKHLMQETKVFTFYKFDAIIDYIKELDIDKVVNIDITTQTSELNNQSIQFWILSVTVQPEEVM